MVFKVAMECHSHQVGLDTNEGLDMVIKVAIKCHNYQVGLDSNEGLDMVAEKIMAFCWDKRT